VQVHSYHFLHEAEDKIKSSPKINRRFFNLFESIFVEYYEFEL